MIWTNYSFGIERNENVLKKNARDPRKWSNPLEVQCVVYHEPLDWKLMSCPRLPNAPSMKIFCVYGHGKETEVLPKVFLSHLTVLNSATEIILVCSRAT
jgi:phospholipid:diacylglycerol acyltransferase